MSWRRLVGCAVLFCLAGCGSEDAGRLDERRALLLSWGEHVIMPLYRDFEARAATLDEGGQALCDVPSAQALQEVRAAWWQARMPWKQAEVLAFGPYSDEPLRLGPKIDFWPARVDTILDVLMGTDEIVVEQLGASRIGLPVVEYLLHEPNVDVVDEVAMSPRRCTYTKIVTGDLTERAGQMRQAWDPEEGNYLAELVDAGGGSKTYASPDDAISEVVTRMGFTVENIRVDKLGNPLGVEVGGSPQPDKAESSFSNRSLDDIRDNLAGIELFFFGDGSQESMGLLDLAPELGDPMSQRLAASRASLDAIVGALTVAVSEDPTGVLAAIDELGELQRFLQVDVIDTLGLTPAFNDTDGD